MLGGGLRASERLPRRHSEPPWAVLHPVQGEHLGPPLPLRVVLEPALRVARVLAGNLNTEATEFFNRTNHGKTPFCVATHYGFILEIQ